VGRSLERLTSARASGATSDPALDNRLVVHIFESSCPQPVHSFS
jgi:hypothetical protein